MSNASSAMRVVDRFVDHGTPLSFRELCAQLVCERRTHLVLDLDNTTHLSRNLGELLAWELSAYEAYGQSSGQRTTPQWFGKRFLHDWSEPWATLRYTLAGLRRWALPGINYLVWGKLASETPWLRALSYHRFGPDPISAVQRGPQLVALKHFANWDDSLLRKLARDVWSRHASDQVISRDDVEWLRQRCPGIQVVLSSASPKPMLEIAKEELGADHACYSTMEWINSGEAKIGRLREVCPQVFAPKASVLAVTDTGYGEDHCWTEFFHCVIDINSPTPFSPVVTRTSPTREVHSAVVLTREEQRRRAEGDESYLDPRRHGRVRGARIELGRDALQKLLAERLTQINQLAMRQDFLLPAWAAAYARTVLIERCRALVTDAVADDAPTVHSYPST